MRTSPLIGRKAWFGPRRVGWGLGPVSPEGWILTLAFTSLALATRKRKGDLQWLKYPIVGGFLLLAILKGAAPGGARARVDFDAANASG
jgi:hypothetical protein